jgi:dihydrolipoamide dehydrogenase
MVVGEIAEGVDLLVVGGGPGGYSAALKASELGREVAIVDRLGASGIGGTCLHVGCIPSKALLEVADVAHRVTAMEHAGLTSSGLGVDLRRFQAWKQEIVGRLRDGIATRLRHQHVQVIRGELTFNRPDRAAVATPDGQVGFLEFTAAVVATGSRPVCPPELQLDGEQVIDSTGLLALEQLPARVAVVGAGYIGVELATALRKLGASVSLIEQRHRVLPDFDDDLTRPVQRGLHGLGVDLLLGARPAGFTDGELCVRSADTERRIPADVVVVAAGRRPDTESLGLQATGATLDSDGFVNVGASRLATPRLAAIGDVTAGPALAHKAMAEADTAVLALTGKPARFEPLAVPAVVFSDPEVVTVGLTASAAKAAGLSAATAKVPLASSGRAHVLGAPRGLVTLVLDRESDVIVGVHLVGPRVSELAGEAALTVEMMASPRDLADSIHPHPTISEALQTAAAMLDAADGPR